MPINDSYNSMQYNFDEIISRANTHSIKWDTNSNSRQLAMWIADMDFKTAPEIISALQERISHGIFGYTFTPDVFYEAIIHWWKIQHGFTLQKEWILASTGVIPSLSVIIETLTEKGDKIIIQPPVYNHFFSVMEKSGLEILENNLQYKGGKYSIDFDDLEKKASDPAAKILLLCNPHNPVGRVWKKEELLRISEIVCKFGLIVISDEIHSDLVFSDFKHISYASLGEEQLLHTITLGSPSKSFNLAGFQTGYIFTKNKMLLESIAKQHILREMELLSPLAIEALIAAYTKAQPWLEALKNYIYSNYHFLKDFTTNRLPEISVLPLQGTYLVWLDCSVLTLSSQELCNRLLEKEQLQLNEGTMYGQAGEGFVRMNIACPRKLLEEGLLRLERVVKDCLS